MTKYNNNFDAIKMKRIALFSIIIMMATITVAIAQSDGTTVKDNITEEAKNVPMNIDPGTPAGTMQSGLDTTNNVPDGNNFPVGATDIAWTTGNEVLSTQIATTNHNEPYENIYKYEVQEHSVYTTPVSFRYITPDLVVYEVMVTSLQSNIASLRIEVLKDTSKFVEMPAPGIVYKNINAWMDYRRIKNATIVYKVENSWIDDNGLSAENVKMSKWDNNSRRWIELLTNMVNKDSQYTYFESQVDSFSSFAISGIKILPIAKIDRVTPSVTSAVSTSQVSVNTDLMKQKDYKKLEISVLAIVVVLIFYVLRIKKKE